MKGTGKGDWEGKMSADRSRRRRGGLFERVGIGGEEGEKGEVGCGIRMEFEPWYYSQNYEASLLLKILRISLRSVVRKAI